MVWEDPDLLSSALEIQSTDDVLSIGSAGCNCLHLLLSNPASVTAIDLSPSQLALIRLKKLAIEKLTHNEFMTLMGFSAPQDAWSLYLRLRIDLPNADQSFFDKRAVLFEQGLSFQGRLESYFTHFRENGLQQIWKPDFIKTLLEAKNLAEQSELLRSQGQLKNLEKTVVEYFGFDGLTRGRSVAQMKYVTKKNIGEKLFAQFLHVLQRDLIRENHFLHLFLLGKPASEEFRPPVYQAMNYSKLQQQLGKLQIVNSDLESFLKNSPQNYSKMNLSDIFEYMSPEQTEILFEKLADNLPVGGRLVYWTLLVDRKAPAFFQKVKNLNLPIDRLWFYDQFFALEKVFPKKSIFS